MKTNGDNEFIKSDRISNDRGDEAWDDVKISNEQIRRILMSVIIEELVLFFSAQLSEQEDRKTFCHRLDWLRDGVTWPDKRVGPSVQIYLTGFLQRARFDVAALTLLLQSVGGFTPDEAEASASILADRCVLTPNDRRVSRLAR
jgi:hypothetical protein